MFENVTNIYVQIMYMQTKLKTPQFIETVFIILEFFNKIGIQDQLKLTYNQLKFTCTMIKIHQVKQKFIDIARCLE